MNEHQNTKIVQQAYDAFKRGDMTELLALLSPDIHWRIPSAEGVPFGGDYRGREEVARFFSQLNESEETLAFEPRVFVAQDDRVAVTGTYTGKVRTTGRSYDEEWVHLFEIRRGRITGLQQYSNTAAAVVAHRKAVHA